MRKYKIALTHSPTSYMKKRFSCIIFLLFLLMSAKANIPALCGCVSQQNKDMADSCISMSFKFYNMNDDSFYTFNYMVDVDYVKMLDKIEFDYWSDTITVLGLSECAFGLIDKMKSDMRSMNLRAKIGFILSLCQSIPYAVDTEIYGEEKVLSPESLLYKLRGDCDDKVILFSYMVKSILDIETIWVEYDQEEHVSCAIKILPSNEDQIITCKNEDFVVAEPTGLFYPLGQGIEIVKNKKYKARNIKIGN